ncbi:RNA polymerase sigma factor [Ruminococcus sp.]
MSKKYFIMNNRENTHDGYTEVSEEFFKDYINSFPEGERAYFINLGYAVMETTKTEYKNFYKEYRRERYVDEEAQRAGNVSLNDIDSDELDGIGVVVDTSEPFEEKVHRQLMIEKLSKGMAILNDEEKALIEMLYFDGMSERQITEVTGIARTTLNYRRNRIMKKLSDFFEN